MWLTRIAIQRPVVIWMALAAIAVLGAVSYLRLPAELNPRVPIPTLTVITVYPGAGPAEVEDQITRPVEDAVGTVAGIRNIYSSSQDSVSIVSIDFRVGTNLDTALSAVRERMDAVRSELPADAQTPLIAKLDINAQPVIYAALTTDGSLAHLRRSADTRLKPKLTRIPGVASVVISGGTMPEVAVRARADRLAQIGVTVEDVVNAVKGSGRDVPGGALAAGDRMVSVRTLSGVRTLDDIRAAQLMSLSLMAAGLMPDLPIPGAPSKPADTPVVVGDVAEVAVSDEEPSVLTRLDGRDSVAVIVSKAPDANAIAVADAVRAELYGARGAELPADTHVAILRDESTVVRDALHDVNTTLVLGAILAVAVVLGFLRNLRGTIIVAVALPASFAATYIAIYFAGFTLNQMTLLALSLSVGILVDDSIVVLESITRHLRIGERPREAAFNGRTEIGFAGVALTLADVVVFLPIAFMGGIVGAFFREFGLTVAFATLISLIVSFTVTPALASRWYRHGEHFAVAGGRRLDAAYGRLLAWALARPGWVMGWCATVLAAALIVSAPSLGFEFLPASDQGQITATVELPAGASLTATDRFVRRIEDRLIKVPHVRHELATVGEIVGGFGSIPQRGAQFAQVNVRLDERPDLFSSSFVGRMRTLTDAEVAVRIRRELADMTGARVNVAPVRTVANVGAALQIELQGQDLEELGAAAARVRDALSAIPGIINSDTSLRTGQPEVQVHLDRARCAAFGVMPAQAGALVRTAIAGSEAGRMMVAGQDVPIRVRLTDRDREDAGTLGLLPVGTSGSAPVFLGDIADIRRSAGPTAIERVNGQRLATVSADLAPGYALGNVAAEAERRIRGVLPAGVSHRFGGETGVLEENIPHFVLAVALAVILLYLVCAALFNSLVYPLIMMLTLPMALIGALMALVLSGETLSLVSMIGVIMLIGLMGRNAILLIDYTNTLRARGLPRQQALREAGVARMRPILMTTLTTIFGMLPVALRIGRASELRAPMAIVVIGGLLVSTLLTLVVIPVAYDWADRRGREGRG
jgi:HAE1 family hydrophobic/amphiphilic exporter-1